MNHHNIVNVLGHNTDLKAESFIDSLSLKDEILNGLTQAHKSISSKFFYDEQGSQLFEKIMGLEEYYPTKTELALLHHIKDELVFLVGQHQLLIEPGAGNCFKVQTLLPSLLPLCYMPIDISEDFIFNAAKALQLKFPMIDVHAVAGDMQMDYPVPQSMSDLQKTIFYPGSTIGNYEPEQALEFLQHIASQLDNDDGLLIGVDLEKNIDVLHRAYNDKEGITALFNLNALNHINSLVDGDFKVETFEHVAFYNPTMKRIEMHLESTIDQSVRVSDEIIYFNQGERIHTEYSYKYTLASFHVLAKQAGLKRVKYWVDENHLFSLQYFQRAE